MKSELKCINELKNLPPNTKVRVYYEDKDEKKMRHPYKKKSKYTLDQIGDMVVTIKDDLKQVNTRLDYIVKANNLKDLSNK